KNHGTWTKEPTSLANQWLQCDSTGANCKEIAGAVAQTYVPTSSDVGHTIRVRETASNAGGSGAPATSVPTATIASTPVPVNSSPPTITGTAQQGQTLTEHHGTWTNEPTSFAYQWRQCDTTGISCQQIAKANAQTYVLTSEDVGHTIAVQETASNASGAGEAATSGPTAVVQSTPATFGKTAVGAS